MKLETIQKINGVDTARLQETVSNVKASPELGRFKFQIANRWMGTGETRSEVKSFYGCGQDNLHKTVFHLAADEPDILLGRDKGANPVEHLLHALVSCVTTSMVYHAAARGIAIEQVESTLDGDLDLPKFAEHVREHLAEFEQNHVTDGATLVDIRRPVRVARATGG